MSTDYGTSAGRRPSFGSETRTASACQGPQADVDEEWLRTGVAAPHEDVLLDMSRRAGLKAWDVQHELQATRFSRCKRWTVCGPFVSLCLCSLCVSHVCPRSHWGPKAAFCSRRCAARARQKLAPHHCTHTFGSRASSLSVFARLTPLT